jgi:acetolactate synthase I/II/III large subunit
MKLSDYIVKFFEDNNIDTVFMVSGGGCMHLVDSFGNSKLIQYWCTEHEQAAAMAAEAYSKKTNIPCIVLVTSGPGATNTITGLLGAYQDSIPCIFISGQAKRKQTVYNSEITGLRQMGVQEVNIIPIVESITKYAIMVNEPEKIKFYLQKALYMAKEGRPGPVWIDIPLDVQSALIDEDILSGFNPENVQTAYKETKQSDFEYFVQALKKSKRPVIIGGHGIRLANFCEGFDKFVLEHKIPVVTPIMGIDILYGNHICNIGRIGTKGTRAGNFSMQNADLIISMGSRLSVSVTGHEYELFAREAKKIIIDIDPIEHKKNTISYDKLIIADIKDFLNKIINTYDNDIPVFTDWNNKCNQWKTEYPVILPEYNNDDNGINYYKFIDLINKYSSPEMSIVSDAGSAFYIVSQAINLKKDQRYITSGAIATMGFSVPAAIGVSVAENKGKVISITGDGSVQQNIQELQVIKFHSLPIKLFIMNNNMYFSIHQTQKKFFNSNFVGESKDSGISAPDFQKIAYAYDISYHKINKIKDAEEKIPEILASNEPEIIEIMVDKKQEIKPSNTALLQSNGIMISKPLEDMYPFLDRKEFSADMIVKPVNDSL